MQGESLLLKQKSHLVHSLHSKVFKSPKIPKLTISFIL